MWDLGKISWYLASVISPRMDMRDLGKVVPRFGTLFCHIWHSLEIFGNLWWCLEVIGTSYAPFGMSGFFVGSQQDLLIPCLCNLAKIWICVILVRWCQDLVLCTATFGILWKSLGIFGDVRKSLGLLKHQLESQVFFRKPKKLRDGNHTHLTWEKLAGLEEEDQRIKNWNVLLFKVLKRKWLLLKSLLTNWDKRLFWLDIRTTEWVLLH